MILRACIKCGVPSKDGYCAKHPKPRPWATSKRRERIGMSGGAWETLRRNVLKRDMGCCYLCGRLGASEVDHLLALADGGTNLPENLASAHPSCHRRKHLEPEWARPQIRDAIALLAPRGLETHQPHPETRCTRQSPSQSQ